MSDPSAAATQLVYRAFLLYFGNPVCTKINTENDQQSTYVVRVYSMLAEARYLVLITYQDFKPKGTTRKLVDLPWISFQTRVLSLDMNLDEHPLPRDNNGVFDNELTLLRRDKEKNKVVYQCFHNPLMVELLPSKKGSIFDYPDKVTLEAAVDTFQCVVYFA
jgi:hypothetical protein